MSYRQNAICTDVPRGEVIARLNDQLRKTSTGGTIMITSGVKGLNGFEAATLAMTLANYDVFDPAGDPHGERDFGCLTLWGFGLLWKIDYFDVSLEFASDDPADPAATKRILTVMLATDW